MLVVTVIPSTECNMPFDIKKNQKNVVLDLRRQGLSYSEIQKELAIPKSTIASWLQNVTMDAHHEQRLEQKRSATAKKNALLRREQTSSSIIEVKNLSSHDIKKISKRELWLMGTILYWKHGHAGDLRTGVRFMSSDPHRIKLFLRWLQEVGHLKNKEFLFDIFLDPTEEKDRAEAITYWSKITAFDSEYFSHAYILRKKKKSVYQRKRASNYQYGMLRVRVRASSLLARQIAGWIEGIKNRL